MSERRYGPYPGDAYDRSTAERWKKKIEEYIARSTVVLNRDWLASGLQIKRTHEGKFFVWNGATLLAACNNQESAEAACRLLSL